MSQNEKCYLNKKTNCRNCAQNNKRNVSAFSYKKKHLSIQFDWIFMWFFLIIFIIFFQSTRRWNLTKMKTTIKQKRHTVFISCRKNTISEVFIVCKFNLCNTGTYIIMMCARNYDDCFGIYLNFIVVIYKFEFGNVELKSLYISKQKAIGIHAVLT